MVKNSLYQILFRRHDDKSATRTVCGNTAQLVGKSNVNAFKTARTSYHTATAAFPTHSA